MIENKEMIDLAGNSVDATIVTNADWSVVYDPATKVIEYYNDDGVFHICLSCGRELISGTREYVDAQIIELGLTRHVESEG